MRTLDPQVVENQILHYPQDNLLLSTHGSGAREESLCVSRSKERRECFWNSEAMWNAL